MKGIFYDLKLLGRHISLGQKETAAAVSVLGHIGYHDTVARTAALDKHVSRLNIAYIYRNRLPV